MEAEQKITINFINQDFEQVEMHEFLEDLINCGGNFDDKIKGKCCIYIYIFLY